MPTRLRTLVLITGWFMSSLARLVVPSHQYTAGALPAAVFDLQALTRTAAPH